MELTENAYILLETGCENYYVEISFKGTDRYVMLWRDGSFHVFFF